MQIDARRVERDSLIETDVCLIGAGAVGITIARELDGIGARVALLESGGYARDEETHSLTEGLNVGTFFHPDYPYLPYSRLRYFGGTTNHWSGWCRPLDAIDFEERSWVAYSGWPFSKAQLDPYYRRACEVVQIASFDYATGDRITPGRPLLLANSDRIETKFFHFSPPTRFARAYGEQLRKSANISVFTNANVRELVTHEAAASVESARIVCLDGNSFSVRARLFVLAAGGIENPRLLLMSTRSQQAGLGNQHDLVGRFFTDHPHLDAGRIVVSDSGARLGLYSNFDDPDLGHGALGVITIAEQTLRRQELLNLRVFLRPLEADEQPPRTQAIGRTIARVDEVARGDKGRWNLSALFGANPRYYALDISCETMPNPESRLTLLNEVDALGLPKVRLDWQLHPYDAVSIRKSVGVVAMELGKSLTGRAQFIVDPDLPWPRSRTGQQRMGWPRGGNHHIGTTRMHRDAKRGVVDEHARVHGVTNLFVGGSSVFPTAGVANPTLTIVALALRLADRIRGLLRE